MQTSLWNESQSINIEVEFEVDVYPGCKGSRGDFGEPMEPDEPPEVEVYDVTILTASGADYDWTIDDRPEWINTQGIKDWAYNKIMDEIYNGNIELDA